MTPMHLVLHALAIKKHAGPVAIAELIGLAPDEVASCLATAKASGRVIEARGAFLLGPLARIALEADYSRHYAAVRNDRPFMTAYQAFEEVNVSLKALITDWQTIEVGGERLLNDHTDSARDDRLIDRLGGLHERAEPSLAALAGSVPRLGGYRRRLQAALERAEDGAIEWVSDAKIESYHTVWFELHEDLLRVVGRERES